MSIRFDADGDQYNRTTNLPPIASWTIMAWVYISVDTNTYSWFFSFGQTASSNGYGVGAGADGTTLVSQPGPNELSGSGLVVGQWNHIAAVVSGTGAGQFLVYLNAVLNITNNGNASTTAQGLRFGDDFGGAVEPMNGRMAAIKVYDAVLTQNEIQAEKSQYVPIRKANLNAFYPLLTIADDEIDYSGNGRTLTVGGTLTTEADPPLLWDTAQLPVSYRNFPKFAVSR